MKRFAGLLLLIAAIGAVVFYQSTRKNKTPNDSSAKTSSAASAAPGEVVTVKGYVGGEKAGFLEDPEIKGILASKYGLSIEYRKQGSIELVSGDVAGQDFLWPSSQFAAEKFKKRQNAANEAEARSETVFNSPLVFYSWEMVTSALQREGLVQRQGDVLVLVDAPAFIRLVSEGKKWKEIGLTLLYGRVTVFSTDPNRSNSGTMFAALLATLLNDGDVPDESTIGKHLPPLRHFFDRMGYMEGSSSDLFKQFLNTGVGANPMIVGYENQMIEYSLEHPEQVAAIRGNVRLVYPRPTMWSSHPLIALTEGGRKLQAALRDTTIQRLAWEKHGFRSGFIAAGQSDTRLLKVGGVAGSINAVVPMPSTEVMEKILAAVGGAAPPATATNTPQ